jgi:hypothetical protein
MPRGRFIADRPIWISYSPAAAPVPSFNPPVAHQITSNNSQIENHVDWSRKWRLPQQVIINLPGRLSMRYKQDLFFWRNHCIAHLELRRIHIYGLMELAAKIDLALLRVTQAFIVIPHMLPG